MEGLDTGKEGSGMRSWVWLWFRVTGQHGVHRLCGERWENVRPQLRVGGCEVENSLETF